jgi:hypothetical protein
MASAWERFVSERFSGHASSVRWHEPATQAQIATPLMLIRTAREGKELA